MWVIKQRVNDNLSDNAPDEHFLSIQRAIGLFGSRSFQTMMRVPVFYPVVSPCWRRVPQGETWRRGEHCRHLCAFPGFLVNLSIDLLHKSWEPLPNCPSFAKAARLFLGELSRNWNQKIPLIYASRLIAAFNYNLVLPRSVFSRLILSVRWHPKSVTNPIFVGWVNTEASMLGYQEGLNQ